MHKVSSLKPNNSKFRQAWGITKGTIGFSINSSIRFDILHCGSSPYGAPLRALQQNEVWLLGNNTLSDSAHKKSHALLFWIFKHTQIAWKIFFWNQNLNMVASKRQNFRNFSSYLFGDSTNRGEIIRITSLPLSISSMSLFLSTPWCSAYQQKSFKK